MNRGAFLKLALLFSLAMNFAVLGAVGFHHLRHRDSTCAGKAAADPSADLDLSPQQETEFLRLRADFHAYRDTSRRRMMALQKELLAELVADHPSQTRIEEVLAQMSAMQSELQQTLVEHLLAEKGVLRPEQYSAFEVILRRHVLKCGPDGGSGNHNGTQ